MPSIPRRGRSIIYAEVEPALKGKIEALAQLRGNTITEEIREALIRHTDYPPPPPAPSAPFPSAPKRKRTAKKD